MRWVIAYAVVCYFLAAAGAFFHSIGGIMHEPKPWWKHACSFLLAPLIVPWCIFQWAYFVMTMTISGPKRKH